MKAIDTSNDDGTIYTGYVESNVVDRYGRVMIPRGADVEMTVRKDTNNALVLDLNSISANGRRYIYVQVDNQPRKLFASGQYGAQTASWIMRGHRYVFVMMDSNGREIARDTLDLR